MHEADDSNYHSLTIGFIPIKNKNEIIAVGDASGSGTKEVWFVSCHASQALRALTSGKCFICKNLRISNGLVKYWCPQRKPVREDSEGMR